MIMRKADINITVVSLKWCAITVMVERTKMAEHLMMKPSRCGILSVTVDAFALRKWEAESKRI